MEDKKATRGIVLLSALLLVWLSGFLLKKLYKSNHSNTSFSISWVCPSSSLLLHMWCDKRNQTGSGWERKKQTEIWTSGQTHNSQAVEKKKTLGYFFVYPIAGLKILGRSVGLFGRFIELNIPHHYVGAISTHQWVSCWVVFNPSEYKNNWFYHSNHDLTMIFVV